MNALGTRGWIAFPVAFALIVGACAGTSGTGGVDGAQLKLSDGKIVLGVLNDQSGVYADLSGKNGVAAVNLAKDDFIAKHPEFKDKIDVIAADHQNKPELGKSMAQEMYERNNADIILDVPTSSVALAVAGVAKDEHKLYINVAGATTDLTGADCNKYTFHYAYDTYMLTQGTGVWATQNLGKKWYVIYPDYAFGQDMTKSFRAAVEKSGGTVNAADGSPFPNQTGDYSNFLAKAGSTKPDVLGTMHTGAELVSLVRQYDKLKLREQKIQLAIGLLFETDIAALGPDAYAGDVYTTPWLWDMDDASRKFADEFKARTGIRPTFAHAGDYSAAWQYLDAVRRAGTDDADAVVKQLEGYTFSDFFIRSGRIRPEDHWVMHDALLAQVKPKSDMKETSDYSKVLATLRADQVSRPLADATAAGCKMPK